MGILSGPEIIRQVRLGNIWIEPFDESRIGPNSYDVCLGESLLLIKDEILDMARTPRDIELIQIPPEGFLLEKGVGYLAHTVEKLGAQGLVPYIDGRSTTGRYFLQVHMTAGRGDDAFYRDWTLELVATHRPLHVYAGSPILQATFHRLEGERKPYQGRYSGQAGPTPPKPIKMG